MRLRHPNEVEAVREARRSISLIRRSLLKSTMEALDTCLTQLHSAVESIHWLRGRLGAQTPRPPGARATLQTGLAELRRELSQVTALMGNAVGFYGGLERLLSPQEDDLTGYAPSGVAPSRVKPTLQLEG